MGAGATASKPGPNAIRRNGQRGARGMRRGGQPLVLAWPAEIMKYQGSCHCGAVRYETELDLEQPVLSCNCSMCGRSGALLAFTPATAFTLQSGEESLQDYLFNKHVIHHVFCTTCGIKPFARGSMPDGTPMVAVNVRCLEGVDLEALQVNKVDGRSR